MKLEVEKKYELSDRDYETIKHNCKFIEDQEIKDYYLDMPDLRLAKEDYHLRLRNGLYELKMIDYNKDNGLMSSKETDDEDEINSLLKDFNCSIDDVTGTIFVDTKREKYSTDFNGQLFTIDIDRYQYGSKYEIEIIKEVDNTISSEDIEKLKNNLNTKINDFIKKLGLDATNNNSSKTIECALHQNIELYEVMMGEQIS